MVHHRVLMTMQPALGHFHPLVPLARALSTAGHEVAFACGRSFCSVVQAEGFPCFPAGPDEAVFGGTMAETMLADLLPLARAGQPTMVVHDVTEWGGYLAAEILGVPHLSVQVGAHCPPERPWQWIGPEIHRLRHLWQLRPDPGLDTLYKHLHLSFCPPSYQRLGGFVPRSTMFLSRDKPRRTPAPVPRLCPMGLPAQPTIYATLGTVSNRNPGVFGTIVRAFRGKALNLLVSVGPDQDPNAFGWQPPNVRIERYVPHGDVLPFCDLIITHGGFNTVMDAIGYAVPMIVVPLFADQPENARRCAALGIAEVLTPITLSTDALRAAAFRVLSCPSYRRNIEQIRDEAQFLPRVEYAVTLLQSMGPPYERRCGAQRLSSLMDGSLRSILRDYSIMWCIVSLAKSC